jgi:sterol 3beta-glucosyltransferase
MAESKKRITILTYGSRGDVQPFVALGVGLIDAGYAVRLVGPAKFDVLVQQHGLDFEPIEGDPGELTQAFVDRAGLNGMRMFVEMARHILPFARSAFAAMERAIADADLVIHSFLMLDGGHTLARLRGVPGISAQFFPVFLPTTSFPAVVFPELPLGKPYRWVSHQLVAASFHYGSRWLYRLLRFSSPDLPALAPWPFSRGHAGEMPVLMAYSRHVLPKPADWPGYAHVTGYWQLPPPADWRPPDDLAHFLDSGSPPVFFSPGSMKTEKLQDVVTMAIASVRAHGQRLLLGVAPDVFDEIDLGADVFAVADVPHTWLFPRMAYILHHGGAGTTGAAAAAGVPTTAIPFTADQAFWARRLHRLGVGPVAPSIRKLTRQRLDVLLSEVLSNSNYLRRARALAEKLRQEDGVTTAVRIVDRYLHRKA